MVIVGSCDQQTFQNFRMYINTNLHLAKNKKQREKKLSRSNAPLLWVQLQLHNYMKIWAGSQVEGPDTISKALKLVSTQTRRKVVTPSLDTGRQGTNLHAVI